MKKDILVALLISLSAYIAYVGSNGELHNIIEIAQGFVVFVFGFSLVLLLLVYILRKINIPSYVIFSPLIVVMLSRRLWAINYQTAYNIEWLTYSIQITLTYIALVVFIILSVLVALKFKHKFLNVLLIFVITGLGAYAKKAYDKVINSYDDYKITSSHQFKTNIKNKVATIGLLPQFKNRFNVYHILIDSYPNKQRAYEMIGYDFTPFYNDLDNRGFKVYETAYSAGSNTSSTLNIMFNMSYDNKRYNKYSTYGVNEVFLTMLSQDYKIFCDYPCYSGTGHIGRWHKNLGMVNKKQYFSMLDNFLHYYFGKIRPIYTVSAEATADVFDNAILFMKQSQVNENYFVYMHELGNFVSLEWSDKQNIEWVDKMNAKILKTIDYINGKDKNAIIILSSDHGFREDWISAFGKDWYKPESMFSVIQAVKFPPQCQQFNNIDILSSVNYYKYVFACLRGQTVVRDLQPNLSIKAGPLNDFWNDKGDPNTYIYINDNKVLKTPKILKQ